MSTNTNLAVEWRCFHCDATFTDKTQAALHFGVYEHQTPACQIDEGKLRDLESELRRYREEDTDLHREMFGMKSRHATALLRAEEAGYAKGIVAQLEAAKIAEPSNQATYPDFVSARDAAWHCMSKLRVGGIDTPRSPKFDEWFEAGWLANVARLSPAPVEAKPTDLSKWLREIASDKKADAISYLKHKLILAADEIDRLAATSVRDAERYQFACDEGDRYHIDWSASKEEIDARIDGLLSTAASKPKKE